MKFTFFYSTGDFETGFFSQWFRSPFQDIEGIIYNTAEQYMMAQKALLFNDKETYSKIMNTKDSREQKNLGKEVKNFNQIIWDGMCSLIVYDGNLFKFSQNPEAANALIKTKGTILVEASPFDKIWGIGLGQNDSRIKDINQWQGKNLLGFVLTKVRDTLIAENEVPEMPF
jgi:ribA/ribD-fused uncharacterized protein